MMHLNSSGRWLAQQQTSSPPLDPPWMANLFNEENEYNVPLAVIITFRC